MTENILARPANTSKRSKLNRNAKYALKLTKNKDAKIDIIQMISKITPVTNNTMRNAPEVHSEIWSTKVIGLENCRPDCIMMTSWRINKGPAVRMKIINPRSKANVVISRDCGSCPCSRARWIRRSVGSSSFSCESFWFSANWAPRLYFAA